MWRFVIILSLFASTAWAQRQSTAYDALKVVGMQFNRAAVSRVISVTGVDGDPQPVTWNVLIADRNAPGGVRELQVANGRIVSNTTPTRNVVGTTEGATIATSKLNLDSSGAFTVANYTADKSHTNFDRVAYTLRNNDRGTPVWIVTLQDDARRPVGTIHISANRGNVTRVEGMYAGANMANVEQDRTEPRRSQNEYADSGDADANNGEFVDDTGAAEDVESGDEEVDDGNENPIKRMFRRTRRDAERMFHRVRRSFDDFWNS